MFNFKSLLIFAFVLVSVSSFSQATQTPTNKCYGDKIKYSLYFEFDILHIVSNKLVITESGYSYKFKNKKQRNKFLENYTVYTTDQLRDIEEYNEGKAFSYLDKYQQWDECAEFQLFVLDHFNELIK